MAFSPNGKMLATGGWDGKVNIWQPHAGNWQQTQLTQTLEGHGDRVFSVAFNSNGKLLASTSGDNTVKIWRVNKNSEIKLQHTLTEHQDEVYGVAFSPDSKTLASLSQDRTVILWDLEKTIQLDEMTFACNWVKDYLRTNQEVEESDRDLCNDTSKNNN